jgi:hypothetical protein
MLDLEEGAEGCLERHVGGLGVRVLKGCDECAMGRIGD